MTTMMKKYPSSKIERSKLVTLSQNVTDKLENLLDYFDIDYSIFDNRISFACPIHEGDNTSALTIFTVGDSSVGNWQCWTHHCELQYKQDIFGFVQGVLSTRRGEEVNFGEVINFICQFLDSSIDNIEPSTPDDSKKQFINLAKEVCVSETNKNIHQISRQDTRTRIKIPADYYIGRGFLPETLDKFDVGLCTSKGKLMSGRVVVPVYDDDHKYMVGCVGRSTDDKFQPKWINSKNFNSGSYLYNYWHAKDHIFESGIVILVEGQGDVWRLDEAGIYNAVGMFGCSLTSRQRIILERSGALHVVIITDADEAGQEAQKRISQQCARMYNVHPLDLPKKDVGDMTIEEINIHVQAQLRKI